MQKIWIALLLLRIFFVIAGAASPDLSLDIPSDLSPPPLDTYSVPETDSAVIDNAATESAATSDTTDTTDTTIEDFQQSSSGQLRGALDQQAQSYLQGLEPSTDLPRSLNRLFQNAASDSHSVFRNAITELARVAAVVLLLAAARGFSSAVGGTADPILDMAGALTCAGILLTDFTSVLSICRAAFEQISIFSATLQPVLATALAMGGSATTATTLQVATMFVFDVVIRLVTTALVPATCAYLAITVMDAATGNAMLGGLANGIKNLTSTVLKLILTLFTAYLAIAGSVSGGIDRMTLKTTQFAVSGVIPVVGGIISDATETMLTGAVMLKNTIGIFGMLCIIALCLSPFLRAGIGYLCYRAGAAVLSPLCSKSLSGLLEGIGTGFGLLLGMLSTCSLLLFLELVYIVAMVKPL